MFANPSTTWKCEYMAAQAAEIFSFFSDIAVRTHLMLAVSGSVLLAHAKPEVGLHQEEALDRVLLSKYMKKK